jgi:hypothetical protein
MLHPIQLTLTRDAPHSILNLLGYRGLPKQTLNAKAVKRLFTSVCVECEMHQRDIHLYNALIHSFRHVTLQLRAVSLLLNAHTAYVAQSSSCSVASDGCFVGVK